MIFPSPRSECTHSFSLVEVVLAIGIVGFSVLVTVALLSVANETNKRAREEGFAAQIAANEFARIRSLGATAFPSPIPTPDPTGAPPSPASLPARFFDSDIKEILPTSPIPTPQPAYELRISYLAAPVGSADVLFNAEVRNPPQAANPNVIRFTTLVATPGP